MPAALRPTSNNTGTTTSVGRDEQIEDDSKDRVRSASGSILRPSGVQALSYNYIESTDSSYGLNDAIGPFVATCVVVVGMIAASYLLGSK